MVEREVRNHHIRHIAANRDKAANRPGINVFAEPYAGIATHKEPVRRMGFKYQRIDDDIRMITPFQRQPRLPQIVREQNVTIWRRFS